jgi:hypothetical protein
VSQAIEIAAKRLRGSESHAFAGWVWAGARLCQQRGAFGCSRKKGLNLGQREIVRVVGGRQVKLVGQLHCAPAERRPIGIIKHDWKEDRLQRISSALHAQCVFANLLIENIGDFIGEQCWRDESHAVADPLCQQRSGE